MTKKAVLWRPMYDPSGHGLLQDAGIETIVVDSSDSSDVIAEINDAQALWVRTPEKATEAMLDAAPNLTVVSTSGFGTDNVNIPAATERGILVVNHLGFGRTPVSEHIVMLLLACLKRLTWCDAAARDGSAWSERQGMELLELEGRTVGIVGLGYIGSELARKLSLAFKCRVLGYDPYVNPRLGLVAEAEMRTDLKAMLSECDCLCLGAELTDETRNIIGEGELAALPEGAVVVNAARGQLIDLDALQTALESGHLRAAGLDVVFPEPLPQDHPLLKNPKVIFTPHTAGVTQEASAALTRSAVEQITSALKGQLPRYPVNAAAWDGPASRRPRESFVVGR